MYTCQSDMLEILTTIVVTVTSFMVIVKTMRLSTKKELFLKIYFPLYKTLSSFLYKTPSVEEMQKLITEINDVLSKAEYIPFFISELANTLQKELSDGESWQDTYMELCRHIDVNCNKLCILLGYPKRTLAYRFHHDQFLNNRKKWFAFCLYAISYFALGIVIAILVLTFCAWLLLILENTFHILR